MITKIENRKESESPETDALWTELNTGRQQPEWWEVAERLCEHAGRLERERDEAREAYRLTKPLNEE